MNRTEEIKKLRNMLKNKVTKVIIDDIDFDYYKRIGVLPKKYEKYQNYIINFKFLPSSEYTHVYRTWVGDVNYSDCDFDVGWNICSEEEFRFLKQIAEDKILKE